VSARVDQFAAALNKLDETGDTQLIAQLFTDEAEQSRPELPSDPAQGPGPFWATYRQQFHHLATSFTRSAHWNRPGLSSRARRAQVFDVLSGCPLAPVTGRFDEAEATKVMYKPPILSTWNRSNLAHTGRIAAPAANRVECLIGIATRLSPLRPLARRR
jgi:hypothetical protein